ncbi:hypothetical protein U5801_07150 [Lamprobacter modestohalophilus]|uniref:hypothetical protein n=1 Tax=Lamprobacter modestohalophilus TaxID=1064514 RepID=UPI002ADEA9C0|nr:hypothetical protein [Lamprobacter modestohalophilus]MEA1049581.1 hypothetical protein [Lamprobacter modestohalophilus]
MELIRRKVYPGTLYSLGLVLTSRQRPSRPYPFVSLTQLLADFAADVAQALEAIDEGDH